jgi:hypothetical protein
VLAGHSCRNDKRDLLPAPAFVAAWHSAASTTPRLAHLAKTSRRDTDPVATSAVTRSICSHLPAGGTPLWLGVKNVATAAPAVALAALA